MLTKTVSSLLALTTLSLAFESSTSTFGYARVQTTPNEEKANVCFSAPGASSKYRLGNECETWIDLGIAQDVTFDNGITMHNQVRPIFYAPNNEKIGFFDWGEAYTEISNIINNNSVTFWIGRRFYERWESHLNDYWPLNLSGDGLGINKYNLAGLKLSYSLLYQNLEPTTVESDKKALFLSHDFRVLHTFERGELTLLVNYMSLSSQSFDENHQIESQNGYTLALLYKDTKAFKEFFNMKGVSVSGLFYGSGLSKDAGEYVPYPAKQFEREAFADNLVNSGDSIAKASTLKAINYSTFENEDFGFMTNLLYEIKDEKEFSGIKQKWFSAGVRPYWFATQNTRLVCEFGYDHVNNEIDNETYELFKSTFATEFAFDKGIWERPVLRLYYTSTSWSDDAKGKVGGDFYTNKTSGDNIGVQLETWW